MEGTSNKRSWSQKHYSNTFKTKKVKTLYANRFKQRAVLAERVTCDKRGLRGSSARRPCLKGHPISTEISYLMPSDCSSSSSHSPTRTNPSRQTLLSRPRTRSSKVYFLLLVSIVNCYAAYACLFFFFFNLFLSFEVLVPHFRLEIVCFDHFSFMLWKDIFFTVLMSILGFLLRNSI
jgi:hypothetical protein